MGKKSNKFNLRLTLTKFLTISGEQQLTSKKHKPKSKNRILL